MAKKQRKKSTFWEDFKKFITKGNVIDMAVAVVIGGAFGKITTGLVNYIITPLTSIFLGEIDLTGVKTVLVDEVLNEAGEVTTPEVAILWGQWIQTIIDFLIIAFVIFVVLRIIMNVKNKLGEKEAEDMALAAAEAKAIADAEAAEKAEKAAEEKARLEARENEFYANVAKQAELLAEIRDAVKKQ
ncbi:MAG: large conductance mechanosensitive channel protein MscL [Clostridia bacterium]|nr:large conductance mechanosensitive channel protein MscL [Clostridia bacterium]